mgnify:CR=1 FL=1
MLRITFVVLLLLAFASPGSATQPQIDEDIFFGPYEYYDFTRESIKNHARLNMDKIFSGFNLSFSYSTNDSQTFIPIEKSLLNLTLALPPEDFATAQALGNYNFDPQDDIGILYPTRMKLLQINEDGTLNPTKDQSFGEHIICRDFIYPISYVIILSCANQSTNELLLGYYDINNSKISYFSAPNTKGTDLTNVNLDEFIENKPSKYFWRYYTTTAWVIEKWEIVDSEVRLVQSLQSSQLDPSWGLTELSELQGYSKNVFILSNTTNAILMVRVGANSTLDVLSSHAFGVNTNVTKITIHQHQEHMRLVVQCNKTFLQTFDIDFYIFEGVSNVFSTGLSDEIVDYEVLTNHNIAIYSQNASMGKAFTSIANFYTKSNGNVIFKESELIPSQGAYVIASKFSNKQSLKFYVVKRDSLDIMEYTRPMLNLTQIGIKSMLNLFVVTVTSTYLDQNISKNYSLPVFYYNESYFNVDTTNAISNDSFIPMIYPTPKRVFLDDLGLKAPFPQIVSVNMSNTTLNDYSLIESFELLPTPDGIVVKDPTNAYWVFHMKADANIFRCESLPKDCEYKGKVRWPMEHKHVKILTEAYPIMVVSYFGASILELSTFAIALVDTTSNFSITEVPLERKPGNENYCQAMKIRKSGSDNHLLCFSINNSTFEASLAVFYLNDLLGGNSTSMRKASLPLTNLDGMYNREAFGVQMEVYQNILFIFFEKNFTLVSYNLTELNFSDPKPEQIKFVEKTDVFSYIREKSKETYLFMNVRNSVLIIAAPVLGIFEEWLVDTRSQAGSMMRLYAQTVTYGERLDYETLSETKVVQPVAYSPDNNLLYMMVSHSYDNKLYIYNLKYLGNKYPYPARLPRGFFSSIALTNQLFGVSAVSKDKYSDYLIQWSEKNMIYEYFSQPHCLFGFSNEYRQRRQIREIPVQMEVSSIFDNATVAFNLSVFKLENPIVSLCPEGEVCNNITLEDSVSWDIKADEYFTGDVLDITIASEKPNETYHHCISFEGRIRDSQSSKMLGNVARDMKILASHIGPTQAFLLTTTTLLISPTREIYKNPNFTVTAINFNESITEDISHFSANELKGWIQFYDKSAKRVYAYQAVSQKLSGKVSTYYNEQRFHQVNFLNSTHLVLVMQCNQTLCDKETFITVWELKRDIKTSFLQFANISAALGVEITSQTEIIASLYQKRENTEKDITAPFLLLALTNRVKRHYLFAMCSFIAQEPGVSCTKFDLLNLITDYNISRYGVEWSTVQVMDIESTNVTHYNWRVLLGNRYHNSYALNLAISKKDYSIQLNITYGLNNYIPYAENTKIVTTQWYIAVERHGLQPYNNLTKTSPYVLYYERENGNMFSVGGNYSLKNAIAVRTLSENEITDLDPYEDEIVHFPINFTNGYTIATQYFADSSCIEFQSVKDLKSHNLSVFAQNFGSFNAVRIGISVVQKNNTKPRPKLPMLIAFGLLVFAGVAAIFYMIHRKKVAERKRKELEEEDNEEADAEQQVEHVECDAPTLTTPLITHLQSVKRSVTQL